eukprot:757909-Hanusia_phi.AAC.1
MLRGGSQKVEAADQGPDQTCPNLDPAPQALGAVSSPRAIAFDDCLPGDSSGGDILRVGVVME